MYLHDLTVILYFHSILPHIVFLHPQPLFDKLSELISISFADVVDYFEDEGLELPPDAHDLIKNKGMFKRDLLECLSDGFRRNEYTADDLLQLLDSLFIIGYLEKQKCYFIPCVLPTCDDLSEIKQSYMMQLDPLILTWNLEPVPQGVFPALIIHLLQRDQFPVFEVTAVQQYRNAFNYLVIIWEVQYYSSTPLYWLEVYYTNHVSAIGRCCSIRSAIDEGISKVTDKFCYDSPSPIKCFFCSHPHYDNPHVCKLSVDMVLLTCHLDGRIVHEVNKSRQRPWLETS